MKISVIILSWNTKKLLKNCLRSLYTLDPKPYTLELIVVDNGSIDGSVEEIENLKLKIKSEIIRKLKAIEHESRAVLDVYPREEIYWGAYAKQGLEIIVSPKREYGFTFGPENSAVIDKSKKKNGCHLESAACVLSGPGIKKKKIQGKIYDVFPTVLELFKIRSPKNLDGRSLI